jgi:hypothetical protein
MAFKPTLVETKQPEFRIIKTEHIGFIGLLSCVVTSFLVAKFSILRKLNDLSPLVYHMVYLFIRFGSVRKQLLHVL